MRYNRHRRKPAHVMVFNATPMVDVIFMLTIFFMLVTRFSSAEQIPMELPRPEESQAERQRLADRVIINCRLASPADGDADDVLYSIGPNRAEPLDVIADRLVTAKHETPGLTVIIRADRRIHYAQVRHVMRVLAANDIEMLNVVAHVSEGD